MRGARGGRRGEASWRARQEGLGGGGGGVGERGGGGQRRQGGVGGVGERRQGGVGERRQGGTGALERERPALHMPMDEAAARVRTCAMPDDNNYTSA